MPILKHTLSRTPLDRIVELESVAIKAGVRTLCIMPSQWTQYADVSIHINFRFSQLTILNVCRTPLVYQKVLNVSPTMQTRGVTPLGIEMETSTMANLVSNMAR